MTILFASFIVDIESDMNPFFTIVKSHISLYRRIYSVILVILLLAGFESITILYTNLFSANKKISAFAAGALCTDKSKGSTICDCTLNQDSKSSTKGNGLSMAEGAVVNDQNGNYYYCDANANLVTNKTTYGSVICDQSLGDNYHNSCIKVSNLFCACDSGNFNKAGGSFGCWTTNNHGSTHPDFHRTCGSPQVCNVQATSSTPNGWPCGNPAPPPPPSQGDACGINSDAGKGATCQETCPTGSTPTASSNNNCGQYYFGDGGYQRQYLCCIPPLSACAKAGGTCCTDDSGPSQYNRCVSNNGPANSLSCPDSSQGCFGPKQPSGAPTAQCGAGSNPPGNDNGWCGTDGNVYFCYQGLWSIKSTCSNGCQTNPGVADTCVGGQGSPQQTGQATPTDTPPLADSPTPSDSPTATPIPPSNTPTGPVKTTASILVHIEGIDAANIPNIVPAPGIHGKSGWPFTIYIYQAKQSLTSTPYQTYTDTMQEITDTTSPFYGMFQNTAFKLYDNYKGLPSGDYKFIIRTPVGSLRKQIGTGTFTITAWASNMLVTPDSQNPQLIPTLLMGDLNGDNTINAVDLNILIDCYGIKSTRPTCIADKDNIIQSFPSLYADYLPGDVNDNGKVDGIDYTTLLTNFNTFGN